MHHQHLFSDKSDLYQRARPSYPAALYDYLASICGPESVVWDCACGSGQAAIGLADQFQTVFATDVSAEQIAQAKPHPGIRYGVSSAEQTSFDAHSLDLICVAQALHWFDYPQFWPEALRVLKPGGVFSAWGYNWGTVNPVLDDLLQSAVLDVVEAYWAPQNKLIWNHYEELTMPFQAIDVPSFDMTVVWDFGQFIDFIHTFSAVRRYMDDHGDAFFVSAQTALEKAWGDPRTPKTIRFDFVFYAGRKA